MINVKFNDGFICILVQPNNYLHCSHHYSYGRKRNTIAMTNKHKFIVPRLQTRVDVRTSPVF